MHFPLFYGITYVTVNKSNIYYELNGIQLYELKPDLYPLYDVNNIPDKVTITHIINSKIVYIA